jgi:hypothetical protein
MMIQNDFLVMKTKPVSVISLIDCKNRIDDRKINFALIFRAALQK